MSRGRVAPCAGFLVGALIGVPVVVALGLSPWVLALYELFDIAVTRAESIVETDGMTDDIRQKPVALTPTHHLSSINFGDLTYQYSPL